MEDLLKKDFILILLLFVMKFDVVCYVYLLHHPYDLLQLFPVWPSISQLLTPLSMYLCGYMCTYVYTKIFTCMHICLPMCLCTHTYVFICIHMYVPIFTYVCILIMCKIGLSVLEMLIGEDLGKT